MSEAKVDDRVGFETPVCNPTAVPPPLRVGDRVRYKIGKGYAEGIVRVINHEEGKAVVGTINGYPKVRLISSLSRVTLEG